MEKTFIHRLQLLVVMQSLVPPVLNKRLGHFLATRLRLSMILSFKPNSKLQHFNRCTSPSVSVGSEQQWKHLLASTGLKGTVIPAAQERWVSCQLKGRRSNLVLYA